MFNELLEREVVRLKEELKSKTEEIELVNLMNQNLKSELHKVGDELYETKIELTMELYKYPLIDLIYRFTD